MACRLLLNPLKFIVKAGFEHLFLLGDDALDGHFFLPSQLIVSVLELLKAVTHVVELTILLVSGFEIVVVIPLLLVCAWIVIPPKVKLPVRICVLERVLVDVVHHRKSVFRCFTSLK